jgi:hypothetical protein
MMINANKIGTMDVLLFYIGERGTHWLSDQDGGTYTFFRDEDVEVDRLYIEGADGLLRPRVFSTITGTDIDIHEHFRPVLISFGGDATAAAPKIMEIDTQGGGGGGHYMLAFKNEDNAMMKLVVIPEGQIESFSAQGDVKGTIAEVVKNANYHVLKIIR